MPSEGFFCFEVGTVFVCICKQQQIITCLISRLRECDNVNHMFSFWFRKYNNVNMGFSRSYKHIRRTLETQCASTRHSNIFNCLLMYAQSHFYIYIRISFRNKLKMLSCLKHQHVYWLLNCGINVIRIEYTPYTHQFF